MKTITKKRFIKTLFALYASFATCFSIVFLTHSNIIDLYWAKATEIRKIQLSTHSDYVSAFLKSPDEYPTFYNASYFYKLQYISRYWNFDAPNSNNMFFKFTKKNEYIPLAIESKGIKKDVDVFCNLYEDALRMFPITLKYGSPIKEKINKSCCEYSYISEELANEFGINESNYEAKTIQFTASRIYSKTNTTQKTITAKIAGVISTNNIGKYSNFISNPLYIFTNWSEDLQTTMNCPDFNVMFYTDTMKNRYYISTIEKSISSKLILIYEDEINCKEPGSNHNRINGLSTIMESTKKHNLIVSVITSLILLSTTFFIGFLEVKYIKSGFFKFLLKNAYWMFALGFFASLLTVKYIFPVLIPGYIITFSEVASTLSITIVISLLVLLFAFDDTLLKLFDNKNNKSKRD